MIRSPGDLVQLIEELKASARKVGMDWEGLAWGWACWGEELQTNRAAPCPLVTKLHW